MDSYRQAIFKKDNDVNRRLQDLGLDKLGLLTVRDRALTQAANAAPPFHPASAAGLFAYLEGVYALRDIFVNDDWYIESILNMEFVRNDRSGVRVGYSNVKVACDDRIMPRARSPKGEIAEKVCSYTLDMFSDAASPTDSSQDELLTYFLMVDRTGAAELTCPTIENGNYRHYLERIFLSDGSDFDGELIQLEDDVADDFDPVVARR